MIPKALDLIISNMETAGAILAEEIDSLCGDVPDRPYWDVEKAAADFRLALVDLDLWRIEARGQQRLPLEP